MIEGEKYIFKDATNFEIRTFVKEHKGKWYSKEGKFEGDLRQYCHSIMSDLPLVLILKSDENVLLFCDYEKDCYVYEYILSHTKVGMKVPITEQQLKKIIDDNR